MTHRSTQSFVTGLAILVCALATNAQAELTAQERLDAIRQSLVEASLQTPTRVQTTTWFDTQGSLRENSSFKNALDVKGVRVTGYDRDESGQPKAKLQFPAPTAVQSLPKSVAKDASGSLDKFSQALEKVSNLAKKWAPQEALAQVEEPICKVKTGGKLKHMMSLDMQVEASTNAAFLSAFLPMVQSHWIGHAKAQGGWRMVSGMPAPSMSNHMTSYERALISNRPDHLPWTAKLVISTAQLEAKPLATLLGDKSQALQVQMHLQVNGAEGQLDAYKDQTSFVLEMDTPAWSLPSLNLNSLAVLQNEIEMMRTQAEEWLACQAVNPVVTAVAARQIEINAGALAGVKKGDEWLVANPARFPAELMGKEGAPQTLLAQVQSVTPFNSQLVVLAGPVQAAQANWRAWPTETLVKEPQVQPATTTASKRTTKPMTSPAVVMTPY